MSDGPVASSGEPLANTAVVEAMRNVSISDTPRTRALLYRLLLETTLLAASPEKSAGPRHWLAKKGDTLTFLTIKDGEGTALPLFTDMSALLNMYPPGTGFVALASRALFEMAAANGTNKVLLNPRSPTSGVLVHREIEALARGRLPLADGEVVAEETTVQVGKPAVPPPPEAIAALQAALQAERRAQRAWYFLMKQGENAPELCVGIQFPADATAEEARGSMATIIQAVGDRSQAARSFAYLVADPHWQSQLAGGTGVEIFRRS